MKIAALMATVMVLLVAVAAATDMEITPQYSDMPVTGEKDVKVCVNFESRTGEQPVSGLALTVTEVCKNVNHNAYCDGADDFDVADEFWVTIKESPTDAEGCGWITLHTADATNSDYAYQISGMDAGVVEVMENGYAYVPEFTVVGAGLALVGAGLFINSRRKKN